MKRLIAPLCLLLPLAAQAQPTTDPVMPPPDVTTTSTITEVTPTGTTTVEHTVATTSDSATPMILPALRPDGFSLGLGFGYAMAPLGQTQTDITVINTTSVRARLQGGMQIEAMVRAGIGSSKVDDGTNDATDKFSEIGVGAQLYFPVMHHYKTDLNVIGLADASTTKQNPEGTDNNTSTMALGLGYGVEVQYWHTKHLAVSVQAGNYLFSTSQTKEDDGTGDQITTTDTAVGLIWDPSVRIMFHLYF